jgi:hypothetical protein
MGGVGESFSLILLSITENGCRRQEKYHGYQNDQFVASHFSSHPIICIKYAKKNYA